jgi:lactam utilization protein B
MQQGSSTQEVTLGKNPSLPDAISVERKQMLATALGGAASMCAGISAIATLSLNEGEATLENVEDINALANELRQKLLTLQSAIFSA